MDPQRLALVDEGRGEPTLVLVHGMGGSARAAFAPQLAHFSAAHRVVAVDLPGHGESPPPDERLGLERLRDLVAARLDAAAVRAPVLVGHSFGAILALSLAASRPDVKGVVALDPPILLRPEIRAEMERLGPRLRGEGHREVLRDFAERSFFVEATPPSVRATVIEALLATSQPALCDVWDAMLAFDAEAVLAEVRAPTLFLLSHGPVDVSRLRAASPRGRVRELAGVGHYGQLERAADVDAAIDAFVDAL